jgi:putative transposase
MANDEHVAMLKKGTCGDVRLRAMGLRPSKWIAVVGAKTAYIERGSPWENGYIERFNARLRDEPGPRRFAERCKKSHILMFAKRPPSTETRLPALSALPPFQRISASGQSRSLRHFDGRSAPFRTIQI